MRRLVTALAVLAVAAAATLGPVTGVALASAPRWSVEPSPNPAGSTDSDLSSVSCSSAGDCVAVGAYTGPNGYLTLVEHLGGSGWTVEKTPNPAKSKNSVLTGVSCPTARWCTAVGYTLDAHSNERALVEAWGGTRWVIQPTPQPGRSGSAAGLDAVSCTAADSCMAVGGFSQPGVNSQEQPLAESWDGSAWSVVLTPNPHAENGSFLDGVTCTAPAACTAGGDYYYADVDSSIFADRWNGSTWATQRQPNPGGQSANVDASVSCSGTSACTSAGSWVNGGDVSEPLAERWNGARWTTQTTPSPRTANGTSFNGVWCATASACMAVGSWTSSSSELVYTLAEMWNGTAWTLLETPNPTGGRINGLSGVACASPGRCVAVGSFWNGSSTQTLIEGYSG